MVQRSRIAPPSDLRSVRQQRRAGPPRPARAAFKHMAAGAVLAGAVYALPALVGPWPPHDARDGARAIAVAAGGWTRAAFVAAFQSIPVR